MSENVGYILGVALILIGIIWIWIGDRKIPVKGGVVLKLLSAPKGDATWHWLKWLMGGAMIYVGIQVIRNV